MKARLPALIDIPRKQGPCVPKSSHNFLPGAQALPSQKPQIGPGLSGQTPQINQSIMATVLN